MNLLLWLAGLLIGLWVVAWVLFEVASGVVHLLLLAGAVLVVLALVRRAGRAV